MSARVQRSLVATAAALSLCGSAAFAQTASPVRTAAAPDPARKALGYDLARLLNSEEITRTQSEKMFAKTFPAVMAADPNLKMAETAYPGIGKALMDAIGPAALELTISRLPLLWDRIGTLYAENLSSEEIRALLGFYRSPVGVRIIKVMATETDFTALIQDAMQAPGQKLSGDGLGKGLAAGAAKLGDRLTVAEQAEVVRFSVTPAGRKSGALGPRIQAIAVAWGNERDPKTNAAMEKVAAETVQKFIAEHGKKE